MTDFRKEMEKTYSVAQTLLTIFGLTPGDKSKLARLRASVCTFFIVFVNLTLINAVCCGWPDISKVLLRLSILGGTMLALTKFMMFMIHRDKIADLLKIMREDFWNEAEKDNENEINLVKSFGQTAFRTNIWQSALSIALWPLSVMRQFKWLIAVILNSDPDHQIPRILLVPNCYTSYIDIYATPYFQILFVSQMMGVFCSCAILATLDSMFLYLVMSICAQFRLVQERIKKFNTQKNIKEVEQYIFKCVQYHQKLAKICEDLNNCYTWAMFFLCVFSSCYIFMSAYMFILFGSNATFIIYKSIGIAATISTLFTTCYCSDYLANESIAVADAAYNCNWVDAPKNIKQIVRIIMIRAQKPIYVTIIGFAPVTLTTFETLMRFSFSVFTMLKATVPE